MKNLSNWIVGGLVAVIGLLGLYVASRADVGDMMYVFGLLLFLGCLRVVWHLIARQFDAGDSGSAG